MVPKTCASQKIWRIQQQTKLIIILSHIPLQPQESKINLARKSNYPPRKRVPVAVADKCLSWKTIKELHVVIKLLFMSDLYDRTVLFHLQSKQQTCQLNGLGRNKT